ncbi:hypothetical protein MAR_037154, partial [Mya arenaria]
MRDSYNVLLTSKISSTKLKTMETTILQVWKQSVQEYNTCNCLTLSMIGIPERVVDLQGSKYWQVKYFLLKSGTVVKSMTSSSLNLSLLQEKLTSSNIAVQLVKEKKTTYKLSTAFSVYLNRDFNVKAQSTSSVASKFTVSLSQTWGTKAIVTGFNVKPDISLSSSLQFVDLLSRTSVYRIYYLMWNNCDRTHCDPLDPDSLPTLTAKELQKQINFTSPSNTTYEVKDSTKAVDFSYHFSVSVTRQ